MFISKRNIFIEQGHDEDGREVRKQDTKDQHSNCSPQPPQTASHTQSEIKQFKQEQAKGRADRQSFDLIDDPIFERLIGLIEAMWEDKSAVVAEGKIDNGIDATKDSNK